MSSPGGEHAMWTCPKCASKVDPSFDVCWNCGTSRDGVEDPAFIRADDSGPIDGPSVVPELTVGTGPGAGPGGELVECYQAVSLIEAKFLANELVAEGIPAVSDEADMQDALGTMEGNPRVYCREEDLSRARAWLESYDERRRAELPRHLERDDDAIAN